MTAQKCYVNRENMVVVTCPQCDEIRRIAADKFGSKQHNIKVKCTCKHVFLIDVEFRRAYRKEVSISGMYSFGGRDWLGMKVKDISKGGVGFQTTGLHNIKKGDKLRIKFTLDDSKHSQIESTVVVRLIRDRIIGCQFTGHMMQEQEKALGFYLMP